jgi:hypothetical protein
MLGKLCAAFDPPATILIQLYKFPMRSFGLLPNQKYMLGLDVATPHCQRATPCLAVRTQGMVPLVMVESGHSTAFGVMAANGVTFFR